MSITRFQHENTVTIASGGTTSGAIPTSGAVFGLLGIPSAMTGTSLTFTVDVTGDGSFVTAQDADGDALSVTIETAAAHSVRIPDACFPCKALKVVASAQGAERTIGYRLSG